MANTTLPGAVQGFPPEMGVRDLGGLPAADGRLVRHGLFFRGSALHELTPSQRAIVDSWGLHTVLDLRAQGEIVGREDYVPHGARYVHASGMYDEDGYEVDFSPAGMRRMMERILEEPADFMQRLYANMMFDNPAVHELVSIMVGERVPLYLHCTAGKDRTGVCAAVALALLGVSDDDIVREYLLTNQYRSRIIHMTPEEIPADVSDRDREHWADFNGVKEAAIRATFEAVDARFPTREAYFADEFGLEAPDLEALRGRYLYNGAGA